MNIALIGLGLIGGSFLKASKENEHLSFYLYDKDELTLKKALADSGYKMLNDSDIKEIDMFILALRPKIARDYVLAHLDKMKAGAIITDLCGIKQWLEDELAERLSKKGLIYAPAHPMAGREVGGYDNAQKTLFHGAALIISPNFEKYVMRSTVLSSYIKSLGFTTFKVARADEHDKVIAYTSQLAHVVSNAFVTSPLAEFHRGYSADSLKDLTRVATMDTAMWQELFILNKENLSKELMLFINRLEEIRLAIEDEDEVLLKTLLDDGVRKKALMYENN